jgi:uncharacterized protein YcfL
MSKFILLTALALMVVGCGSDPQIKNNPETPKPTQAQLDAMPPEAAKHAAEMSDYAKAQAEMNKGRVAPPKK